jgi:hypothetical protein
MRLHDILDPTNVMWGISVPPPTEPPLPDLKLQLRMYLSGTTTFGH